MNLDLFEIRDFLKATVSQSQLVTYYIIMIREALSFVTLLLSITPKDMLDSLVVSLLLVQYQEKKAEALNQLSNQTPREADNQRNKQSNMNFSENEINTIKRVYKAIDHQLVYLTRLENIISKMRKSQMLFWAAPTQ